MIRHLGRERCRVTPGDWQGSGEPISTISSTRDRIYPPRRTPPREQAAAEDDYGGDQLVM